MKRGRAILVLAVCCVVAVGFGGFQAHSRQRIAKATDVACDYVEKKYPFDVKCVNGEYGWDLAQYYIHFETTDKEPLHFTVLVQRDLKISEERCTSSGETRLIADNYLHCKFEREAESYIKTILKEDRAPEDILVYCNDPLYAYRLPADVDETSSFEELLQKMDYNVVLYYGSTENSQFKNIGKTLQEHGVNARDVLIRQADAWTVL